MARQRFLFCLILTLTLFGRMAPGAGLALAQTGSADSSRGESPAAPGRAEPRPESASKTAFRTKYAQFEPANFSDLPGWRDDKLGDAWLAFRQTCAALQKKSAWEGPCSRSKRITGSNDEALRQFFQQEFNLYQIHNSDHTPAGVITGYYEPLLTGSRRRGAPYLHPVYAVPDDLLFLDARTLPAERGAEIRVRVEGRNVIPSLPPVATGPGTYKLVIAGVEPDLRTRRYRLRIDGERVTPYFSRQEIERGQMSRAKVIVWVNSRAALYSMQIQGSGKVRLPNGEIIRVAYGEQNGHPFLPSLQALPQQISAKGKREVIATRGLGTAPSLEEDARAGLPDEALEPPVTSAAAAPLSRGVRSPLPQQPGASEVDRMIESLSPGHGRTAPPAPESPPRILSTAPHKLRNEAKAPSAAPKAQRNRIEEEAAHPMSAPGSTPDAAPNSDPSYVFFQRIPDNDGGPIGALGVPLTAGRSVAVDPRTTPLGFPVFISTRQPGRKVALNRLMLAQDTGGAIRGAVRADYFWGFGTNAFVQASHMKEVGRMWLLLPKNQKIPATAGGTLLRSTGGPGSEAQPAECVVPDPELCVE